MGNAKAGIDHLPTQQVAAASRSGADKDLLGLVRKFRLIKKLAAYLKLGIAQAADPPKVTNFVAAKPPFFHICHLILRRPSHCYARKARIESAAGDAVRRHFRAPQPC